MRALLLLTPLILGGCAYTQPMLAPKNIADLDKLKNIAEKINLENANIEVRPKNGPHIEIYSIDKRVPWQILTYEINDVNNLISMVDPESKQVTHSCETIIEVAKLGHEIHPVGLNYWEVYLKGSFVVFNSCTKSLSCKVDADYKTDYYFSTTDSDSARYSEAIIGVILKAVVAAQSCPPENRN